jgi:polyphosphate:AMP phosphotransferase
MSPPSGPGDPAKRTGKAAFKAAAEALRVDLVNAQYRLREADFSVVVLLAGRDRPGCEQVVDRLQEWMDARYLDTWFAGQPSEEERARPPLWRYWRAMPPAGRVGLFAGAWIIQIIAEIVRAGMPDEEYRHRIGHFNALDGMLAAAGTPVLKIWLDLPKKVMKQRLKAAATDPDTAMYMEALDSEIYAYYDASGPVVQQLLSDTSVAVPWTVIDGSDERARDLAVARAVLTAITGRLDAPPSAPPPPARPQPVPDHLGSLDLDVKLPYPKYRKKLDRLQLRLHELSLEARYHRLGSVLVFEGQDAAGKGGVIRRITQAISARDCKVIPIAAPTDEELAHHYLWRFWRRLPRDGAMRIFDRSWYGRVLVERVEGLASAAEWGRAYDEINDFEAQIVEHGQPVLKFWLHIDPDEQLRRFKAREKTGYKKYKITAEDYRNRDQWPAYAEAVNEMVDRTGTADAPWHLVAANDKRWARVRVLETVCAALEKALDERR